MKLSEAYDKMAENPNIPKEVTAPVFKIMNACSRGKYTEEQAREDHQARQALTLFSSSSHHPSLFQVLFEDVNLFHHLY